MWHYVNTKENPADLVSRGIDASELIHNRLWWHGPEWLETPVLPIGPIPGLTQADPDEITAVSTLASSVSKTEWSDEILSKFNSLMKLKRVTVFILRRFKSGMSPKPRHSLFMSVSELDTASKFWIAKVQHQSFSDEIKWLKANQEFPNGNKIKSLNPFMDEFDILRVGGRLQEAMIPEDMKYPIILPKNHHIVKLIVQDTHIRYKHAGGQLMTSIINASYWVIGLKHSIRRCIKNCMACQKVVAEIGKQMMGNLPKARISKSRPFLHTGVDYAGPIKVLPKSGRGQHPIKCWIAVFVCFAVKAVHLELVTELSTRVFIAALRRFTARRGKPQVIYSDEGTNFVGAKNEMMAFQQEMLAIANNH